MACPSCETTDMTIQIAPRGDDVHTCGECGYSEMR